MYRFRAPLYSIMRPRIAADNGESLALWEWDNGVYTSEVGALAYKERCRQVKEQHQQRREDNGSSHQG